MKNIAINIRNTGNVIPPVVGQVRRHKDLGLYEIVEYQEWYDGLGWVVFAKARDAV